MITAILNLVHWTYLPIIEKKRHLYIEERISVLKQYIEKLCPIRGDRYPELFKIIEQFNASAGELAMHIKKEELVLFHTVRKMLKVKAKETSAALKRPHFGRLKTPFK